MRTVRQLCVTYFLFLVTFFTLLSPAGIAIHSQHQPIASSPQKRLSQAQSPVPTIAQLSAPAQPTLNYSFHDNFEYSNMSQMESGGWTECGSTGPYSYASDYRVTPGLLSLVTDWDNGSNTAVCWNKVPSGISNWSVSTRGAWIPGGDQVAGTIQIMVTTTSHTYIWGADGMFQRYILWRDGYANGGIWTGPLYTAQMGVWHDLRMDFVNGVFHLYLDGLPMADVPTTDTGTNLTSIILKTPAGTDNSFVYVSASAVDPNAPDFTLIAGPTSQNIPVGQNATFTVSLASVNGFSGTVDLATTVSPDGTNSPVVALSHAISLTSGGSALANLTVTTFQVISASTFNIRINATSGNLYHAIQVSAVVTAPSQGQSVTLTATPSSLILRQAGNGSWNTTIITIHIFPISGFTGTVALSVGGSSPPGPVAVISPSQILITGNKTFTATLSFQGAFLSGTWQFGITAVSAGLSVSTSVSVDFIPSYFNVGVTPSENILVASGSSTQVSLNLISVNGYASNVSFSYYSVFALPANPPAISFSPASLTPIPDGTMSATVTVSTSSNTPTGPYTFIIVVQGGWATTDRQVNVYVVNHAYTPGVRIGTTATYSVSFSSLPGVPITVTLVVTNVTGPVVDYTQKFYVNGVLGNTTTNSINIVTGTYTGTIYIPFPFVATGLNQGDAIFPALAYGSISITSTSTTTLAGVSRLTFSTSTLLDVLDPVQFTATWDSGTGVLGILDGNVPINSTTVTAHYVLTSTNAWTITGKSKSQNGFLVSFTVSPTSPLQFSTVTFVPTIAGGVPPYHYYWDFGDGQSSTQSNPTHSYLLPGTYHITLTVTDKNEDVQTQTSTIEVSVFPTSIQNMIATLLNRYATPGILLIGIVSLGAMGAAITAVVLLVTRRGLSRRPATVQTGATC